MDVLGQTIEGPVAALLEVQLPAIEAAFGQPIAWQWDKKLPEGFLAQCRLQHDGRPEVLCRPDMRDDLFPTVIAHEVTHVTLTAEGYPRAQSAKGVDERLGLVFFNTFLDPEVNARLQAGGIERAPLQRYFFANVVRGLFERNVHEPTPLDAANSALWTCTFVAILLTDGLDLSDEFRRILHGRYSATMRRAVALSQEVRRFGWSHPDGCARSMEFAREQLKLRASIVIDQGAVAAGR